MTLNLQISVFYMPTIFRLSQSQLSEIAAALKPDEGEFSNISIDKLRIIISEWLLLNGFSSLHNFTKNSNSIWICPNEAEDCDCCWRFRVGRRKIPDPILLEPCPIKKCPSWNPPPRREDQMMYFNGPWVFEERQGKKGKKEYTIRSHLLKSTTYEEYNFKR